MLLFEIGRNGRLKKFWNISLPNKYLSCLLCSTGCYLTRKLKEQKKIFCDLVLHVQIIVLFDISCVLLRTVEEAISCQRLHMIDQVKNQHNGNITSSSEHTNTLRDPSNSTCICGITRYCYQFVELDRWQWMTQLQLFYTCSFLH